MGTHSFLIAVPQDCCSGILEVVKDKGVTILGNLAADNEVWIREM
jgi:hypothetical protein